MTTDPLAPAVRRLFADLQHAGRMELAAGSGSVPRSVIGQGEAGRVERGTRVCFRVRSRGGEVAVVRYHAYGCPHTLAACEWLSRELEGGRLAAELGGPGDWCRRLGIPIVKLGRLLVVEDALLAALHQIRRPGADAPENVVK